MDNKENKKIYIYNNDSEKEISKKELSDDFKESFESCNINFLIGSGYSISKLEVLGNIEKDIESNSREYKDKDIKIIKAFFLNEFFNKSIYPHSEDINIYRSFEDSNRFINILKKILLKRNDNKILNRINIFTTNYDTFFELSLEESNLFYNDGFSGNLKPYFSTSNYNRIGKKIVQNTERESPIPTINLYKMHGSLTWEQDNDEIFYNRNIIDILNKIKKTGKFFNDFKNLEELKKSMHKIEFQARTDDFIKEYSKLNIINPTKKKFQETLLLNNYYEILRMYSNELEKNNSLLIVFGFSFKDEHIRTITERALNNPTMMLYIFIYNKEELDTFKKYFKKYNNVKFIYSDNNIDLRLFNSIIWQED